MRQLRTEELLHALDLIARKKANEEACLPIDTLEGQAANLLRAYAGEVEVLNALELQALSAVDRLLTENRNLREMATTPSTQH